MPSIAFAEFRFSSFFVRAQSEPKIEQKYLQARLIFPALNQVIFLIEIFGFQPKLIARPCNYPLPTSKL
mgnify:CR=1 FL=1